MQPTVGYFQWCELGSNLSLKIQVGDSGVDSIRDVVKQRLSSEASGRVVDAES